MRKEITGYVTAKNHYWYIVVSTRDGSGKRIPKWINTGLKSDEKLRADAENRLKVEIEEREKAQGKVIDSQILLVDFVSKWLSHYATTDIASTTYEVSVMKARHITDYFGPMNVMVKDITPLMANDFYEYLRTSGKRNQKDGTLCSLSIRTVQDIKNLFNGIMDYAVMLDVIKSNPIHAVKVTRKKKKQLARPIQYMDFQRAEEFLNYVKKNYDRSIYNLIWVALTFGLRRSEILGLKMESVDLKQKYLKINSTVTKVTNIHKQDRTKTDAGCRGYKLSDSQVDRFREIFREKEENREFFGKEYIETPYLITWENGKEYSPDYVTSKVKKILTEFGEPNMSLHKLRHSTASILCEKGYSIKEIQYYLGHCDASTTMNIYTHMERQSIKAGMIEF